MSDLTDLRDIMAEASEMMAGLFSERTVDIFKNNNYDNAEWSDLKAIIRTPSFKEQKFLSSVDGRIADLSIDIPRQGSFTGDRVVPGGYIIRYGEVVYEIIDCKPDDTGTPNPDRQGRPDAAVYTYFVSRTDVEIGSKAG